MAMVRRRILGAIDGPRHSTSIEKNVIDGSALDGGHMDRMTEIGEADLKLVSLEGQFREKREAYFKIEASPMEPSDKRRVLEKLRKELVQIKEEHEEIKKKANDALASEEKHLKELDDKCKKVENTVHGIKESLQFSEPSVVDEAERVLEEMQSAFEFQKEEFSNAKNIVEGHQLV